MAATDTRCSPALLLPAHLEQRLVKRSARSECTRSCGGEKIARVASQGCLHARMLFCLAINIAKGAHSPPLKCLPSANCQRESQPLCCASRLLPHLAPTQSPSQSQCLTPTTLCHLTVSVSSCSSPCSTCSSCNCDCSQSAPSCFGFDSGFVSPAAPFTARRGAAQGRLGHLALNFTRKLSN